MTNDERQKKTSLVFMKLSKGMILLSLLENGPMSTTELAKDLYFTKPRVSNLLKELKEELLITIDQGHYFDSRKNRVRLTALGEGQAVLIRASTKLIPGKDELAIAIRNALRKLGV